MALWRSRGFGLPLGNSRISNMSLRNGPVLMMLQKPQTLNQTNYSLQCLITCKTAIYSVIHCSFSSTSTNMKKMEEQSSLYVGERGRTRETMLVTNMRDGCDELGVMLMPSRASRIVC